KLMRRDSLETVINKSINLTLSRTVLTSLTTLFAVVSLFIFGGSVIHDFAFAVLAGVLVGTYSSIFVASALVLAMQNWRAKREKRPAAGGRRAAATTGA
ncbi:MAG: protein translocase subunit SecF, partial [Candidatus Eiseniibacteriota bacterium]